MDFVSQLFGHIMDLVKLLFNIHWAVGIFGLLLIVGLVIMAFQLALLGFILYGIYLAFMNGNYIAGSAGIVLLVGLYAYGQWSERNKERDEAREKLNHQETGK
jgi:hypothetical protein